MNDLTEQQMMDMSDEDIMNMSQPPAMPAPEVEANDPPSNETDGQETPVAGLEDAPSGSEETPEGDDLNEDTPNGDKDENPLNQSDEDLDAAKSKEKPKAEEKSKDKTPETDTKLGEEDKATADNTPDYKKFFEQITGEFKASGRKMKVKTAEEAVALMQRGADYTRKMQALKPSLRIMKMLENNGLLDEAKLSHFIDLDKKDPAAIAKFLKDKQVDPLDLDMSQETEYKPGNHAVSDEEMRFNSVLEDVQSTPFGRETIQIIDKQWDRASQGRVFKEPQILKLIDTHRETGIYDQVTSEVDRLKLLGVIPDDAIFLDAYKTVADELHKHGRLLANGVPTNQMKPAVVAQPANPSVPVTPPAQTTRQVLETRPAQPKPQARNSAAARAAAPTRSTPNKPTVADFNPLSMSDEEFEKQAGSFRL